MIRPSLQTLRTIVLLGTVSGGVLPNVTWADTIAVDTRGIRQTNWTNNPDPAVEKAFEDALIACILAHIKANLEAALGSNRGSGTVEVTEAVDEKGKYDKKAVRNANRSSHITSGYKRGQKNTLKSYGNWPGKKNKHVTHSMVYLAALLKKANRDNFKTDGNWDIQKLCQAIAVIAAHEIAHSYSAGHCCIGKMKPQISAGDLGNLGTAWSFSGPSAKAIKDNWGKKACYGDEMDLTAFLVPYAYDDPDFLDGAVCVDSVDVHFEFWGALTGDFDLGWYAEDTDGGEQDGHPEADFIYKSSMEDEVWDAHTITFLEDAHVTVQFLLRGQEGTPYAGLWFPAVESQMTPSDFVIMPDGREVFRHLTIGWDVDGVPGMDVGIILDAFNFHDPYGPFLGGWELHEAGTMGACCGGIDGTCVEGSTVRECADLNGRWIAGVTCDPDPFTPPCGMAACCLADGSCQHMTRGDCASQAGVSYPGTFCFDSDFTCLPVACINAVGSCDDEHATRGCQDTTCCEAVCNSYPHCCDDEWDALCVEEAALVCAEPVCGDPGRGECCAATDTPGCEDAACCEAVCFQNPFCCAVEWDGSCAELAWSDPNCSCTGGTPPPNDDCAEAIDIFEGETAFDTMRATTDGPVHEGDCQFDGQTYHDIWYIYTATATEYLSVTTCGIADYDTDLVVYHGNDCGDLTLLSCNDDGNECSGYSSKVMVPVVEGNEYLIRLGGWGVGDMGAGTVNLWWCPDATPLPPAEDWSPVPVDNGFGTKNRYLTFAGGWPEEMLAARVTFTSLPGYEYAEGRSMWVQEPSPVTESSGSNGPTPPPTLWAAELGCSPYYTDWSVYDRVDVYDDATVPLGSYDVQFVHFECPSLDEEHFSAPLNVQMGRSGDIVGDCGPTPCTAPQGVVDFVDISACVEKFRNLPGAPRKARADVINSDIAQPLPDRKIDFVDISCVVEAFRGAPCLLPGPPVTDPCARR